MELSNYLAPCCAPEATLHCTLPWTNPRHETRRLLFRYTPKYLHVDGGTFTTTQPAWVDELTDVQRAVLEPPYTYGRPEWPSAVKSLSDNPPSNARNTICNRMYL
jgi:hypothetical protein